MFIDRKDAGQQLASRLGEFRRDDVVVLGLPRGVVKVAAEVAQALDAPLDVIVVRKLGAPSQPELGVGAVGEGGVRVINKDVKRLMGVTDAELATIERAETIRVRRRAARFRAGRGPASLSGRTAVLVDDGVATGSTARAACHVARAMGAERIVLAVPVASPDVVELLRTDADEVICVRQPPSLGSVGQWYDDFRQVTDDDVVELLSQKPMRVSDARIDIGEVTLLADMAMPVNATGIVIFVHGSGSGRRSPRNVHVANVLNDAGIGTLLFDLLTEEEAADRSNVFDIVLLAQRLIGVTRWVRAQLGSEVRIGWFGASTGGGAALWAAAEPSADVAAIVSRGGRPDLAADRLGAVRAPTLFIVGGNDEVVLRLNRGAAARMNCPNELSVVPGATHLFEESGTLAEMTERARDWFVQHLSP
ncbi:MAG: phosphoribosyltransferase [Corynebacteriales bacterium]|nr:phosphoribosyltransferase [Mycobacteriales bacterium]